MIDLLFVVNLGSKNIPANQQQKQNPVKKKKPKVMKLYETMWNPTF